MKVGFGLITTQRVPGDPRGDDADLYAEALATAEECERLGFDSIWVSEHHFLDDGYMAALMPVCAALAARTSRIEIGTGVLLAPLHDPIRLAEDAAAVDLISRGRLILGLGKGWRQEEFDGVAAPTTATHRTLEATIQTLRDAWGPGLATGRGTAVPVTPKPPRPGGPPIWIGAGSEQAIRRAARIADGFLSSNPTVDEFARQCAWLRDELERAGRDPAGFRLALHTGVFAWEDGDPWALIRDHAWYVTWKYKDMAVSDKRLTPARHPDSGPTPEEEAANLAFYCLGTPDEVAARIRAYEAAAHASFPGTELHVVARLYLPGLDPATQQAATRLFAQKVLPQLR
jgi:alkanesulfonate monooxygenase SsuD/methylene tetrahydromethanopterin reductase-like flavin-dependent oxidoreductase (luciferase family)